MLQNILNLEGVTALDKQQQQSIKGGDLCFIRLNNDNDTIHLASAGNDDCLAHLAQPGVTRCQYDCFEADGEFTASWLQ